MAEKKLGAGNGAGEKLIETVPKLGYRFASLVEASDEAELIIEEETLTRISIEETLTLDDSNASEANDDFSLTATKIDGSARRPFNSTELAPVDLPSVVSISPSGRRNSGSSRLAWILGAILLSAIGLVVYQNFFGGFKPRTILAAKVAPFAGLPGREQMPAFSPDGKQIVFSWNGGSGDNADVYVKFIGSGEPVRLTSAANDEIYPVFSPDARSIAFVRVFPDREEVILIPALGGAERRLCELRSGRASISFSPDGQTLVVADTDANLNAPVLFLLDWQTGERRRLTDALDAVPENTPRFSPDGKLIAFLRYFNDAAQELMIVPAAGGTPQPLTFDRTEIRSLAWNADGRRINFVSLRQNNQPNLWRIEAASGAKPELLTTGGTNIRYTAAAPDGKTVAFTEESDNINIWQLKPAEKSRVKIIESIKHDVDPQFSLDGKRILFASERNGSGEIWISDADGKNQRQLTDSPLPVGSPRFSPDGKFVAYNSQDGQIFIISAEGGSPRRLTENNSANVLPAWSADGLWIYFMSNRSGDFQLWKMPVAGGESVQLTKQTALQSFASPDGKWIYYSKISKTNENPGLWRISIDGENEAPIAELAAAGFARSWTATASGIYYVAFAEHPPYRIMFYDFADGSTREMATVDQAPLPYSSGLSVSADGKTILYAQKDEENSSIMLAEIEK